MNIPLVDEVFVVIHDKKELFASDGYRWHWTKNFHDAHHFKTRQDAEHCMAIRAQWIKGPVSIGRLGLVWISDEEDKTDVPPG